MDTTHLNQDFDQYVSQLTQENRNAITFLVGATALAAVFLGVFLWMISLENRPFYLNWAFRGDAGNALGVANICANLAVGAALKIWYTRQDKMTTLLTHAMVLSGEEETAIRVLLNKKLRRR